jgi:hypothetical protein
MNVSTGVQKLNESFVDTASEGRSLACSSEKNSAPKKPADVTIIARSAIERENVCKDSPATFEETCDMMSFHSPALHVAELSKIERIGVISVLEDCIDQLYILGKTNRKTTGPTDWQYRSLKERCMLLYCCKCKMLYAGMLAIRNVSSISSQTFMQGAYD